MTSQRYPLSILGLFMLFLLMSGSAPSQITSPPPDGDNHPWPCHIIDNSSRGADGVRLADINKDGHPDIATGWEEGGLTRIYLNPGIEKVKNNWPFVTVGSTPAVEDAVLVDLDQDDRFDVVSSCEGKTETLFVHWAPTSPGDYTKPNLWTRQALPASKGIMKWMYCVPFQMDGRYGLDLLAGGKGDDAAIGWFEAPSPPRYLEEFTWHPLSPAGWIMSLKIVDMDEDGHPDILTSDRKGPLRGCRWLKNPGPGPAQKKPWSNAFIGACDREVMFLTLADLDRDGLQDILVAANAANRSVVVFLHRLDTQAAKWKEYIIPYPPNTGTAKAVAGGDINLDGRLDLVISCEHADAGKSGVVWLSCTKSPLLGPWHRHEISGPRGIKYDRLELLDLDRDGDLDVLTCEERENRRGLGIIWYENPTQ